MRLIKALLDRALPALLMATSVVLLSAGLFAYAPPAIGENATPTEFEPGDPNFPTQTALSASPSPLDSGAPSPTTPDGSLEPSPSVDPGASFSLPPSTPPASLSPGPTGSVGPGNPGSTATPTQRPGTRALATRIVVPSLDIDLAILPGNYDLPGNRNNYPLCGVAQYLMEYSQPGEPGTTYVYAHARRGMFLPLLEASQRQNGRSMIGALVEVYTNANQLHLYEIYVVKRHATNLDLAHQLPPEGHQLIMQTSEGPRGTIPKLQVAARPLSVVPANARDANPEPAPRVCR